MPADLHANPNRIMPAVPGINAQPLRPSIGCDHWRTSASAPVRPKLRHRAKPTHGLVDLAKVPANFSAPRERKPESAPVRPSARARKARAKADHASRLALFPR